MVKLPSPALILKNTFPTTAKVGIEFVYEFKASDPENDALTFSIDNKPDWLSITYNRLDGGTLRGTPLTAGDVSFDLKVSDGQLDAKQSIHLTITGVGIDEISNLGFKCYPNPVNSILYIESPEPECKVSLFNLSGVPVYTATNATTISMETLPAGLYFLYTK